ncbi:MAG TPA: hypothetical protein VJ735_09565 [Actinomycetes bacterium]|nr:hypothetical protein [Actinomycetes bacterium]
MTVIPAPLRGSPSGLIESLLVALVWTAPVEPGFVLAWSRWRRRHRARARRAHYHDTSSTSGDRANRGCPGRAALSCRIVRSDDRRRPGW